MDIFEEPPPKRVRVASSEPDMQSTRDVADEEDDDFADVYDSPAKPAWNGTPNAEVEEAVESLSNYRRSPRPSIPGLALVEFGATQDIQHGTENDEATALRLPFSEHPPSDDRPLQDGPVIDEVRGDSETIRPSASMPLSAEGNGPGVVIERYGAEESSLTGESHTPTVSEIEEAHQSRSGIAEGIPEEAMHSTLASEHEEAHQSRPEDAEVSSEDVNRSNASVGRSQPPVVNGHRSPTDGATNGVGIGLKTSLPKLDADFMEAAAANKNDTNAEWRFDPSDAESRSSTLSSDVDSTADEESEEEGYDLLTAAEQVKILMNGAADEADEASKNTEVNENLRTHNEKPEERVLKSSIMVTPDMHISELGTIENIVEQCILIKATITGETQVLESGSVLCLEDRTVLGAVAETLGKVQQPRYSVAFSSDAEIEELHVSQGMTVYYVEEQSSFVFTQALKLMKGSDASNFYDEEAGGEEIEFSDDEAEAEYKRQRKWQLAEKRGKPSGVNGAQTQQGRAEVLPTPHSVPYSGGALKYEDEDEDDDMYRPLARPQNALDGFGAQRPPVELGGFRGRGDRNRGSRGRGNRARNDRGGRGHGPANKRRSDRNDFQDSRPQSHGRGGSNGGSPQIKFESAMSPPHAPVGGLQDQAPLPFPYGLPSPGMQWGWAPNHQQQSYSHSQPNHQQHSYGQSQPNNYQQSYGHSQPNLPQQSYGHSQYGGFSHGLQQSPQQENLPAGAFVNPAFFGDQQLPAWQQQSYRPPHQLPYLQNATGNSTFYGTPAAPQSPATWYPETQRPSPAYQDDRASRVSPESDTAFRAAQERLNLLRNLGRGSGSP